MYFVFASILQIVKIMIRHSHLNYLILLCTNSVWFGYTVLFLLFLIFAISFFKQGHNER